jgi:hypothetical protein
MPSIATLNARVAGLRGDDLELEDQPIPAELIGSVESITQSMAEMVQRSVYVVDSTIASLSVEEPYRPEQPYEPSNVVGPSVESSEQLSLLEDLAQAANDEHDLQGQILQSLWSINANLSSHLSYIKKRDNRPEVLRQDTKDIPDLARPLEERRSNFGETGLLGSMFGGLADVAVAGAAGKYLLGSSKGAAAASGVAAAGRGGILGRVKGFFNPATIKQSVKSTGKFGAMLAGLGLAVEAGTNYSNTGELGLGQGFFSGALGLTDEARLSRLRQKTLKSDSDQELIAKLEAKLSGNVNVESAGPSTLEIADSLLGVDTFSDEAGRERTQALSRTGVSLGAGVVGAKAGAIAGAAIGSIVPGIGTAIGAAVGGIVGGVGASLAADDLLGSTIDDLSGAAYDLVVASEGVVGDIADGIATMHQSAVDVTADAMMWISNSYDSTIEGIGERADQAYSYINDRYRQAVEISQAVVDKMGESYDSFVYDAGAVLGAVAGSADELVQNALGAYRDAREVFNGILAEAQEVVQGVVDGVGGYAQSVYDGSAVENVVNNFGDTVSQVSDFFSDFFVEDKPQAIAQAVAGSPKVDHNQTLGPDQYINERNVVHILDQVARNVPNDIALRTESSERKVTSFMRTTERDRKAEIKQVALAAAISAAPLAAAAVEAPVYVEPEVVHTIQVTGPEVRETVHSVVGEHIRRVVDESARVVSSDLTEATTKSVDALHGRDIPDSISEGKVVREVAASSYHSGTTTVTKSTQTPVEIVNEPAFIQTVQRVEVENMDALIAAAASSGGKTVVERPQTPATSKPIDDEIPLFIGSSAVTMFNGGFI